MSWDTLVAQCEVAAKPDGFWTLALDYLAGPLTLRISAGTNEQWLYSRSGKCGPDGDSASLLRTDNAQFPAAPIGALIAKVGGSSAGWQDSTTIFLAGSFCVYELPATACGPLFLTINDEYTGMSNNSGIVIAQVSKRRADAPG